MPRAVRVVYWLAAAVAACLLGTTLAVAPTYGYHYDVATIARVEVGELDDAPADTARLDDLREGSVSTSVEARGASTTASATFIATESAGTRFVAGSDGVVTDLVGGSPNSVVLGKYPAYVNQAAATGSRAFSISDEAWNAMTPAEQWARNQQFLDQAITRGSDIQLATAPTAKNLTGFYAKEINYLTKQGYTISSDGTRMIPPGG